MYNNKAMFDVVDNSVWDFPNGRVICGSIANEFVQYMTPGADCIYTDPPWDDRVLSQFYKYANIPKDTDFMSLIHVSLDFMKKKTTKNSVVVMEMGLPQTDAVKEAMKNRGFRLHQHESAVYGSPARAYSVFIGSFYDSTQTYLDVGGRYGSDVLDIVVNYFYERNCQIMLDPFAGKLSFLIKALNKGMPYVCGVELIPDKLATGLQIIANTGREVRRVA